MAATQITDDDEGKKVVDQNGDEVGIVSNVQHGTAHVDPNPGLTDKVKSKLGWGDKDEDTYPLQAEMVQSVTDDEVRLNH
ncbi:PRC-barrel domain containing protein [Haladaptatus sp. DFWS20]|uniref:PRC-barrel domain containing protein n=1 Tax=Haladaptatus sp. DFWS20 TaxID=3403467 RepID=UPI003EBD0D6E